MRIVVGAAALAAALALPHAQAALLMGGTAGGGGGGTPIAFVQSGHTFTCAHAGTCAMTLPSTAAGNFFAVGVSTQDSTALISISGVSTSNGRTCTVSPGSTVTLSTGNFSKGAIFYCENNPSSGSVTITATFTSAPDIFAGINAAEFSGVSTSSPDIGVGNQSTVTSASSATVTTNGNLTQANQLVFSTSNGSANTGVGAGQTLIDQVASYQLTDSSGATVTHSYTFSSSGQAIQSIAVFSHP